MQVWKWLLPLLATLVLVLGAGAAGVAYLSGAFSDEGRFATAPSCDVIDDAIANQLIPGGTVTTEAECKIRKNVGSECGVHFEAVRASGPTDAPEVASQNLRRIMSLIPSAKPVPGLGDEAFESSNELGGAQVLVRVSNLVIGVACARGSAKTSPTTDVLRGAAAELVRRVNSR